jgi:hypothetical protein
MPYPLTQFPDDELALIQYLRTVAQVTALVDPKRITTELPPAPTYPVVLISRAGGTVIARAIDDSALQVDVVDAAGRRYWCKQLAHVVRSAVLAIANDAIPQTVITVNSQQVTIPACVLVSGFEEIGPQYLPDTIPIPPLPRYTARYRVVMHA